jgi:chemotaxis protein methyltransferase CheR
VIQEDALVAIAPSAAGRPRVDLRHVTFPSPRAHHRPLNLAPVALPATPAAPTLVAAACRPEAPPGRDTGEYEPSFSDWLFYRAGLDPHCYKADSLERRLPACLRALRVDATHRARSLLRRRPEMLSLALDAALVGVTSFFRDAEVFAHLRSDVLPALVAEAGERGRPVRVWSAGCSSGKELYSVGMLLAESGASGPARARLLGTDARGAAVDAARAGRYADADVDAVPADLCARYFERDGPAAWRVTGALRSAAEWHAGNLLRRAEPGPWDLILCRNVGIYLRPDAAARLWRSLAAALRPGGRLVLGRAERPTGVAGLDAVGPCVYQRAAALHDAGTRPRTDGRA